jgi:hypothetical protein
MEISDFNGSYKVNIASNIHEIMPGYHDFGEAVVEIKDGILVGKDDGGISWNGKFMIAPENEAYDIVANVVVDPRTGQPDAVVMHYDGQLRREPVTHDVGLVVTKVNSAHRLQGKIQIGPIEINVSVRQIG